MVLVLVIWWLTRVRPRWFAAVVSRECGKASDPGAKRSRERVSLGGGGAWVPRAP